MFYLIQSDSIQGTSEVLLAVIKDLIQRVEQRKISNMKGIYTCLHNFVSLFLAQSPPETYQGLFTVFEELEMPRHAIYEIVTKHFRKGDK